MGSWTSYWVKNGYKTYRNLDKTKLVKRHIHEEWNELFRDNRL